MVRYAICGFCPSPRLTSRRIVIRNLKDASTDGDSMFDYIIACMECPNEVSSLAADLDRVATCHRTCLVVNTTYYLATELSVKEQFPMNVVLSFIHGFDLTQLGQTEIEHKGSAMVWVGGSDEPRDSPQKIRERKNMALALSQTLSATLNAGRLECKVSPNIRQLQYERIIGRVQPFGRGRDMT